MRKSTHGFTVIELLFTIAVITIIATLTMRSYATNLSRGRDTERKTDMSALYLGLEEYYYNNDAYPETFTSVVIGDVDPKAMVDPRGGNLNIESAVADNAAAGAVAAPSQYPNPEYQYIPINCTAGQCEKYVLRSFLENVETGAPYHERKSVN